MIPRYALAFVCGVFATGCGLLSLTLSLPCFSVVEDKVKLASRALYSSFEANHVSTLTRTNLLFSEKMMMSTPTLMSTKVVFGI